jgi:hypothetical protein
VTAQGGVLKSKLLAVARWEKRKRLEETLLAACSAALAMAIVLLPLNGLFAHPWLRWLVPVILLAGVTPFFIYRRRWTARDEVRALAALDRTLNLDERALTAWDLSARRDTSAAAQMVFQQAERRLQSIEPRTLFPRRRSWAALAAPGLVAIWLMLLWLEVDRPEERAASRPQTLAQKAREYAREFQEKARNEGLRESLKMGQELEKVARRGTDSKRPDEQFKKELSAMAQKFDEAAKAGAQKDATAAESGQALKDLQAELAALRDLAELPELPKGAEQPGRQWSERLASMPQLKRRLNEAEQSGQGSPEGDLKAFLQQLERRVSAELDRRALIDAQQYLKQMMNQGAPPDGENLAQRRHSVPAAEEPGDGQREKNASNLPGKEPGQKGDEAPSMPEFRAGPSTQVKGALKEGESTGLSFKAKPAPGTSTVPASEVVAAYRRQAEQELNSERVPAGLKETIKNYFLSLGDGGR